MNTRNRIAAITIAILAIVFFYYWNNPPTPKAFINGHEIVLEVAASPSEKELGLGYRKTLSENKGMLFVFDHKEKFGFWMKGMEFPLDFVWIDDNNVVDLTENVPVYTNGKYTSIQPQAPVNRILELNSGSISRFNISVGDKIEFITK